MSIKSRPLQNIHHALMMMIKYVTHAVHKLVVKAYKYYSSLFYIWRRKPVSVQRVVSICAALCDGLRCMTSESRFNR